MPVPAQPAASRRPPVAWTIAGSDPGGGAGIQADLKTFHGLGVYGGTVLTALTVQNSRTFESVEPVAMIQLADQVRILRDDLPPAAVKLGMLPTLATVRAVAEALPSLGPVPVVCDPILQATLGATPLDLADPATYLSLLGPVCTVITPNRSEAERLAGHPVTNHAEARDASERFRSFGFHAVVIKSVQIDDREARDWLFDGTLSHWIATPARPNLHTHGAGCTYSAALAAGLAHGFSLLDSVLLAKAYVAEALRDYPVAGHGRGPLDHGGWPNTAVRHEAAQ